MKKIKILVLSTTGFMKREGISTVIYDYFSNFDKDLFEINLIVDGSYDVKLINEFNHADIKCYNLHSRKRKLILYVIELFKLLKKQKFDVVYANGSSAIMCIELILAKLAGCKIRVVHSHNTTCDHIKFDRVLRPLFYRLYTDAFACGYEAGKWLFESNSFKIIKNGRHLSKYRFNKNIRTKARKSLGVNDDCLLIGHVGNFNYKKNHQFVLKVFKELLSIRPDARLYLMGTGKLFNEMNDLAVSLGISENVIFTGSISNVNEMLQAMDVMIFPSIHEGLPLAVVEWQIAALPCIISDRVTKEVAFCDLVRFMSLDSEFENWAQELVKISDVNRGSYSNKVIVDAKSSGYDLDENVKYLQSYFLNRCR